MFDERYVTRLDIYDDHGGILLQNAAYELSPRRFHNKAVQIIVKGFDMAELPSGSIVWAVATCRNGERLRYRSSIGVASSLQWTIYLRELAQTDEDRRSFCKVDVDCSVEITAYTRDETLTMLDPPAKYALKDLSAGGMFIKHTGAHDVVFEENDLLVAVFNVMDTRLENTLTVLRKQHDKHGNLLGYGCRFIGMSTQKEELLSRFVYHCQLARNSR